MRFIATASQPTPFLKKADAPGTREFWRRRVLSLAAVAILLSGALVSWALVSLRQEALLGGERLTNSLAHVIAEQTTRTFQTIDQRLQMAAADLDRLEASGELNRATAEELLHSHLQRLPFVRALRVVNAEGLLVYGSDEIGLGATVTDRPYFQIYRTNPETTFYIGAPALSPTGSVWFISASWPLRWATGSFAGVIVAVIDPKYFEKLWSAVDLGVGGSVILFRRDAVFLVRTPWDEGAMGKAFPQLSLFTHWLRLGPTGTFQASGAFDATPRIFAYRTLPTQPELVVIVGRSYEFVLAGWAKFRTLALAIWGLASLLVIGLAVFLRRSWREHQKTQSRVEEMAQRLTLATDAASIGVWDWNLETDQWFATDTYFAMLGTSPTNRHTLRNEWLERVHPDDRGDVAGKMEAALTLTDAPYQHETRLRRVDGSYRWMHIAGRVLSRNAAGRPTRLLGVMIDITESKNAEEMLRSSLRERDALLKEVHHRVKNNLQVIVSLLRLEAGRSVPATRTVLKDMQDRIQAMAMLHQALYQTGDFARVDLAPYLSRVSTQLCRTHLSSPSPVRLELDLSPVHVRLDQAIPCGLIANELVSNSLKHAFPDGRAGVIRLSLRRTGEGYVRFEVSDTGIGLPSDFLERKGDTLGLQLVGDLARQLGGGLEIGPPDRFGFVVQFKGDDPDVPANV
jgi:two-component sensor histidine kinase/PAS domain-containing protein